MKNATRFYCFCFFGLLSIACVPVDGGTSDPERIRLEKYYFPKDLTKTYHYDVTSEQQSSYIETASFESEEIEGIIHITSYYVNNIIATRSEFTVDDGEILLIKSTDEVSTLGSTEVRRYSPSVKYLPERALVGTSWTQTIDMTSAKTFTSNPEQVEYRLSSYTIDCEVVGFVDTDTPFGTIETLLVRWNDDQAGITREFYYSDNYGLVMSKSISEQLGMTSRLVEVD